MGEASKTSGELGEKIAEKLLEIIGWLGSLHNVNIPCNNEVHIGSSGNQRKSHGEDRVYIYNNPFHDDFTEVVHVSVKNNLKKYPVAQTLRKKFRSHYSDLQETIDCAVRNPEINELISAFRGRSNISHSGLLIWVHNDENNVNSDIKKELSSVRLDQDDRYPVYLIDNERAGFILSVIDHVSRSSGDASFYYPQIGTSIKVAEERCGSYLPLELIASDVVLFVVEELGRKVLYLYANQPFESEAYKKLIHYALKFSAGLVNDIKIGMPDFNVAKHDNEAKKARFSFQERKERIEPFSFKRSILNLLE